MIIVACTDDPELVQIAQSSSQRNQGVFGAVYKIFAKQIPQLGTNENLFIISHGAFRSKGNAVIGDEDQRRAFEVNGVELFNAIRGLFPGGYSGHVYIDACYSADTDPYTFSFCETFHSQIAPSFGRTRVFGRNGASGGSIPLPGASGWREA